MFVRPRHTEKKRNHCCSEAKIFQKRQNVHIENNGKALADTIKLIEYGLRKQLRK